MLALFAAGVVGVPFASRAQKKDRLWRVGIVFSTSELVAKVLEGAFLAGMKDRGYDVGRNLIVDSRFAEGNLARYSVLIDEVIALRPDILIGTSAGVAIVMKQKTTTIPIVMGTVSDAVGVGLAQSLGRPGGNVTGVSLQLHELSAKHIEIMGELLPRMRRVALLTDLSQPKALSEQYERIANTTATAKGLALEVHGVDSVEKIHELFQTLQKRGVDALLINPSPRFNNLRREIIRSAASIRLPSIGFVEEYAQEGGLISYGPSFVESLRRVAYYVDRIFNGAKPSDLPIEQPTKFSLVINARTAKALGIKIPGPVLLRADRVIE